MQYIAFAALVVVAVTVTVSGGVFRSMIRQHGRERQQLLDRICHLAGKTWTAPPSEKPFVPEVKEPALIGSPEQMPEGFDFEAAR